MSLYEYFGLTKDATNADIKNAIKRLNEDGVKFHYINETYPPLLDLYSYDCKKIAC